MTVQESRNRAEEAAGTTLTESEFQEVLAYTRHKARLNGKGEDYVPLLLYDEIRNYVFREQINRVSHDFMQISKLLQEGGYGKCASCV